MTACTYCGDPADATDHVQPRAYGGTDAPPNLVPACTPCNSRKGVWPAELLDASPMTVARWLMARGWKPAGRPRRKDCAWESPDPAKASHLYSRSAAVREAAWGSVAPIRPPSTRRTA